MDKIFRISSGRVLASVLAVLLTGSVALAGVSPARTRPASNPKAFEAGAAQVDITPPLRTAATDTAQFVPACGSSAAELAKLWTGKRIYAGSEPYIDLFGAGEYQPGDPYCDADHAHRYQAPYLAGGGGQNRWPESSDDPADGPLPDNLATHKPDTADPLSAQAVVFKRGNTRVVLVTVDSIGMFDTTMDQIRAAAVAADPKLNPSDIFISSTHNESAPDPIGLWGPSLSAVSTGQLPASLTSGVDEYYMQYLVKQVAAAIVQADTPAGHKGPLGANPAGMQPARLKIVTAQLPSNIQSCWSSYPFIDAQLMPVMQGVNPLNHHVVFTLVNGQTHDETLAFGANSGYNVRISGDWPGHMREDLESAYHGSVGMEMSGLVGSVETPTIYEPQSTQVLRVPGPNHGVNGNPDGCSSVYPNPKKGRPVDDAESFINDYGASMASATEKALRKDRQLITPSSLSGQSRAVCLQLENQLFLAAFGLDLFPDRPIYANPQCTTGLALSQLTSPGSHFSEKLILRGKHPTTVVSGGQSNATTYPSVPAFLKSEVGVANIGPAQIVYTAGEVFPFTELGGPIDEAQMPFPTSCFAPNSNSPNDAQSANYLCGSALPDTPNISDQMTGHYKFFAGLGDDMLGYLFPPGNFVGSTGETVEAPWAAYEEFDGGNDRFGYGHADDAESVGPHAGLAITDALQDLLKQDKGTATPILPGMFIDAEGHLCDSPFPAVPSGVLKSWITCPSDFTGAIGVEVVEPSGAKKILKLRHGGVSGWATYDGTVDPGTAGTAYKYSVSTRGVIIHGRPLLIDVFSGAKDLGLAP